MSDDPHRWNPITPDDEQDFLLVLLGAYSGSRLRAELVEENGDAET